MFCYPEVGCLMTAICFVCCGCLCVYVSVSVLCFVLPQLGASSETGDGLQMCNVVPNAVNEKSHTHPIMGDLLSWVSQIPTTF
jgi:hypothetical protein